MRILVCGARGYLGTHYLGYFAEAIPSFVDIADAEAVARELDRHQPDVVINCAGKTGRPNIDWCENHRAETVRSNLLGPIVLAEACQQHHILLVQLSSGCLYEGTNQGRGFGESDAPNFFGSFYCHTKTQLESLLHDGPVLIIRPRMPFDDSLHPRSLIGKLVKYPQILDAPNSISYVPDLLAASRHLIEKRQTGTFNVVNEGVISPYAVMQQYHDIVDRGHNCERLTVSELEKIVSARRSNCRLNTDKLQAIGFRPRNVASAVRSALLAIRDHAG